MTSVDLSVAAAVPTSNVGRVGRRGILDGRRTPLATESPTPFDPALHEALMSATTYVPADRWTHMLDNEQDDGGGWVAVALCRTNGAQRLHIDWRAVNCPTCREVAS